MTNENMQPIDAVAEFENPTPPTIIQALRDPQLLNVAGNALSVAQETCLRAVFGLPLGTPEQLEIFHRAVGRAPRFAPPPRDAWLICGRKSGKTSHLGPNIAAYDAAVRPHNVPPGESSVFLVVAPEKAACLPLLRKTLYLLEKAPSLRRMVRGSRVSRNVGEIALTNGVNIIVSAADSSEIRNLGLVAGVIVEEGQEFPVTKSAGFTLPELLERLRPCLITNPQARLTVLAAPGTGSGLIGDVFRRRNTPDELPSTLVWRLDSQTMNPNLSPEVLAAERARGEEYFRREYLARFTEEADAEVSEEQAEAARRLLRDLNAQPIPLPTWVGRQAGPMVEIPPE